MKFNFLHFLKITAIEVGYFYLLQIGYPLFSMLMFGEGANSFMYTNANGVMWICLMIVPPTIFNIYKINENWNGSYPKSVNYSVVELLMIILTANFAVNY